MPEDNRSTRSRAEAVTLIHRLERLLEEAGRCAEELERGGALHATELSEPIRSLLARLGAVQQKLTAADAPHQIESQALGRAARNPRQR
jgi:hypothetical protein